MKQMWNITMMAYNGCYTGITMVTECLPGKNDVIFVLLDSQYPLQQNRGNDEVSPL